MPTACAEKRGLFQCRAYVLGGRWATVAAPGMCAFSVIHIQIAHFGTVVTLAALFATATIWLLIRFAGSHHRFDSLLAGACLGLALGCKATYALLVAAFLFVHLCVPPTPTARCRFRFASINVWLSLTAIATAMNPYAILDPVPFVGVIATQAAIVSGCFDWPCTRQFAQTLPIWYAMTQQTRWGLGLPMALAAYAGLGWATWTAHRRRDIPLGVVALLG